MRHLLIDYLESYFSHHADTITTEATKLRYRAAVTTFSHFLRRPVWLADLTDATVEAFAVARLASQEVSPETVRSDLARLKPLSRWLYSKGIIPQPLTLRSPLGRKKLPRALTRDEARQLWEAARKATGSVWGLPASIYWPAYLGVAYESAARIGAILAIRRPWISVQRTFGYLRGCSVRFPSSVTKGDWGDQVGYLRRGPTLDLLRLLEATDSETPLNPRGARHNDIYRYWHVLVTEAGLPWAVPHSIRKTHATWLHRAGGDATVSLYHSSTKTTWDHYLDRSQLQKRPPSRLLPSLGGWLW